MIIYIEKQAKDYPQARKILEKFSKSQVIFIDHYKNIFDKSYKNINSEKSLIIAKLNSPSVTQAPKWYWHTKSAYFFKTSLNCVFDCSYCYLKWAFKNENMVVFVNYDDIKKQIEEITSPPAPLLQGEGRWTLVSNPPYWDRLKDENIKSLYNNIDKLFRINTDLSWWIISSYLEFDELIKKWDYKKRKLYNWWEKCYFWRKNKKN